jgi:HEPN domain-containing protein
MPDESTSELARQWLEKATEDLEAARRLTDLPHVCSFHCQQAVEKGIKAVLVLREVEFARTHDIDILLRQLGDQGLTPGHIDSEDLAALTRFAVDTRYPPETSTAKEAEDALDLSEQFLEWAKIQIPAVESDGEEADGDQRT